eukprot:scaffold4556_cov114-Isochrysis_galbana.AAC.16
MAVGKDMLPVPPLEACAPDASADVRHSSCAARVARNGSPRRRRGPTAVDLGGAARLCGGRVAGHAACRRGVHGPDAARSRGRGRGRAGSAGDGQEEPVSLSWRVADMHQCSRSGHRLDASQRAWCRVIRRNGWTASEEEVVDQQPGATMAGGAGCEHPGVVMHPGCSRIVGRCSSSRGGMGRGGSRTHARRAVTARRRRAARRMAKASLFVWWCVVYV